MEFVVIIATLLVIVLQLIVLANQQKTSKNIAELIKQNTRPAQSGRSRDRNSSGSRHHRKNFQEPRSKSSSIQSSPSSGSDDNVEKSLRDINLRLKNAERDQEAARRKIKENIGKDHSKRRHSRGKRDDNRGANRRDRYNRNNRRNRNNRESLSESNFPQDEHSVKENVSSMIPDRNEPSNQQAVSLPDLNPTDFDSDTTQHGRKFTVKRRVLKEESESFPEQGNKEGTTQPENSQDAVSGSDTTESRHEQKDFLESPNTNDIHFGRR